MTYEEVIDFMYNSLPMYQRIGKAAYKADLQTTQAIDRHFEHPHRNFKSIHVAGTNGKGSVSHSIASVLQEAGYKTGLYTSPHLIDYRERIRVNGEMISKEFVTGFIENNLDFFREITPSFFEMSVALAFEYFKYCEVDIAIIEVGMGGRLDSTNIITPELSVITNIGFDHTQFLGDTLEKIAGEKAGIIKKDIPVIIGETQSKTKEVFAQKAKEIQAQILFAEDIISNTNYEFELKGPYQEKNLKTILASIKIIQENGFNIEQEHIKKGLQSIVSNTDFRGRWETINKNPLCICDTGHNKEGLSYTIPKLLELKAEKLRIVLGFVDDKNVESVLELFPKEAEYYFTKSSVPRALDEKIVYDIAKKHKLIGRTFSDVMSAYNQAMTDSSPEDVIFVGGSTFVVADLLSLI